MGIFDNAINVTINNQEVESITTNNNGLIYQKLPYKLTLTANKNSINVGETVTFTAFLTNRNKPVANEIIDLCGITLNAPIYKTIPANTPTHVGCKYSFPTIPTLNQGEKIYLNEEHTIEMFYGKMVGTSLNSTIDDSSYSYYTTLYSLTMENGIMTVGYSEMGTGQYTESVNCQSTNTRIITSSVNVTINDYGLYGTTNANGIATITYIPTSTGTKTITAKALDLTDTIQIQVT